MGKSDSLLDLCVKEAERLGYGCSYGRFVSDAERKCGSLRWYFGIVNEDLGPAPRGRCKICRKPIPEGSRHRIYCSDACFDAWKRQYERERYVRRSKMEKLQLIE